MSNLVDKIERYIKRILEDNPHGFIVIQRNGLATQFECAPSQINYVLSTRFSVDQGYLVESRRGGGGYLRIIKLGLDTADYLETFLAQMDTAEMTQATAEGLIGRLLEEAMLTKREAMIIKAIVERQTLNLGIPDRDRLRARLIAAVLRTLAREDF